MEVGEELGGGGQREGGEFAVEGVLGEVEVAAAAGGEFAEGAGLAVAAVAVFVEGEKGVIAGEPARAAARTVAVVIEENGVAAGDADGFEAVTVEIEGEGVDAGTPAAGAEVEVVERRVFCAMGGGYEKIEYQLKRIDIKQAT